MLNGVFKIVPPSLPLNPTLGLVPLRYGIHNDFKPPFLSLLPIRNTQLSGLRAIELLVSWFYMCK